MFLFRAKSIDAEIFIKFSYITWASYISEFVQVRLGIVPIKFHKEENLGMDDIKI